MTKYLTKSNLREELNSLWFTVGAGVYFPLWKGKHVCSRKKLLDTFHLQSERREQ